MSGGCGLGKPIYENGELVKENKTLDSYFEIPPKKSRKKVLKNE